MSSRIPSKALFFLALTSLLLVDQGVLVKGYNITAASFLFLLTFFLTNLRKKTLVCVCAYFFVTILSSYKNIDILLLIKLTLVCLMMASITSGATNAFDREEQITVTRYFERTFQLVFFFVLIEFLAANILGVAIYSDASRLLVTYGSFVRPFFWFAEPSILSIYAVFSFIVFDLLEHSANNRKKYGLNKALCVLLVILTVSATGAVMLFAHQTVHVVRFLRNRMNLKNSMVLFRRFSLVGFGVFIISLVFPEVFGKLYTRFIEIKNASIAFSDFDWAAINLNSSTGYRLLTIFSVLDYATSGSYTQILLGEGFLNFHGWIIDRYSVFFNGAAIIDDGDVTNLVAVVFLSGGMVGTLIFALYILSLLSRVAQNERAFIIIFVFCFMLVFGSITEPHFFIFIYLLITLFNKKNVF